MTAPRSVLLAAVLAAAAAPSSALPAPRAENLGTRDAAPSASGFAGVLVT